MQGSEGSVVDIGFLLLFLFTSKVVPGVCGLCVLFQHLVTRFLVLGGSFGGSSCHSSHFGTTEGSMVEGWCVHTVPWGRSLLPPACPAAPFLSSL